MARYEDDYCYYQIDKRLPGNPWFLCTLWLAGLVWSRPLWMKKGLPKPSRLSNGGRKHALRSGVLPEQVHALYGRPTVGVAARLKPHATLVSTVHRILRRLTQLIEHRPKDHWMDKSFSDLRCDSIYGVCRVD